MKVWPFSHRAQYASCVRLPASHARRRTGTVIRPSPEGLRISPEGTEILAHGPTGVQRDFFTRRSGVKSQFMCGLVRAHRGPVPPGMQSRPNARRRPARNPISRSPGRACPTVRGYADKPTIPRVHWSRRKWAKWAHGRIFKCQSKIKQSPNQAIKKAHSDRHESPQVPFFSALIWSRM